MPHPVAGFRLLNRALVVWFILIAVEFIHGALRTLFLVPVVGDFRARQIGVFIGSALILLVAYLFVGWLQAAGTKSLSSTSCKKSVGDGFHLTSVEVQKRGGLVELHLQRVDYVVQANGRGHHFETIILPALRPRRDDCVRCDMPSDNGNYLAAMVHLSEMATTRQSGFSQQTSGPRSPVATDINYESSHGGWPSPNGPDPALYFIK